MNMACKEGMVCKYLLALKSPKYIPNLHSTLSIGWVAPIRLGFDHSTILPWLMFSIIPQILMVGVRFYWLMVLNYIVMTADVQFF